MKNILIVLGSSILGLDLRRHILKMGHQSIYKDDNNKIEQFIEQYDYDLLITTFNSDLVKILSDKLKYAKKPVLFLSNTIVSTIKLDEIKIKWDLLSIPFDFNEFDLKFNKLLQQ